MLFVCTANICRSPLAEGVFRAKIERAGWSERFTVDSAGTHDFRLGEAPDARAVEVARRRGYALADRRARRVRRDDLVTYEYVLAMDMKNMTVLHRLGEPDLWQKPELLMGYSRLYREREVADPYGGGDERFEMALDMIESATDGLLAAIRDALRVRGEG